MIKKTIKALWIFLAALMLLCVIIFASIAYGWIGYMPPVEELENPNYKFATEILSEDGKVLGTWSLSKENRIYTSYDELSNNIINALIATEDVRFTDHSGIDAKALVRAVVKRGLLFQKNAGGGSTITQQLAKQLFTEEVAKNTLQRLFQKPIEWVIAVKLERYYTKEEILSMYLNKFDFLNNAVGIKTAAYTYFGREPKDLTVEEAATLVGMCKNPSLYNPVRFNERSKGRRNVVLGQMEKADYITEEERDSLQALPLKLAYHRVDHKEGLATYFREYLRGVMAATKPDRSDYRAWQKQKYYEDSLNWETNPLYGWCAKNKKKDGSNYNLYTDGLKIYTTIDSRMQKYAEEAVTEHLSQDLQPKFFKEKKGRKKAPFTNLLSDEQIAQILDRAMKQTDRYRLMKENGASEAEIRKAFNTKQPMTVFSWQGDKDTLLTPMDSIKYYKYFLRAGFMSMDPINGYVKAYVGGPNYTNFQYDMAMVGRRQVGSTIKPYLYALAMENGFSPCDEVRHVEQTLIDENGTPWTPRNANNKRYGEMVTIKWGLANSDNWVTAYLMSKLNPYALARLIQSFGVRNRDIVPSVSLSLGPCEISVGEMVSAYTAFANKGIRVAPLFVTRIEDSDGNVISTFAPQMEEVISASTAYKMLVMLRAVINEGTGGRVRRYGITADMGGKTGTTNLNSDGWFMGFTPSLVSGVWVGGEERDIHFDGIAYGQGASLALPIWGKYMKKVYDDKSLGYDQQERFNMPEGFEPCAGTETNDGKVTEPGLDELFN
ncbi:transglycosylase domain-containing protein [Bacteroides sp.]|uniref:transglycosylase domain-containing protein n=1 Tax=Bacteroides sp. TaxID=29523 RepID=UPI001B56C63E|nr:transglycosylase domain-containing protein [Bacteroides sp.]MBP6065183.1 transglycosylase domain-containing protein [Bacteroides sp.]MBP6066838.1 transglycosylase domain-containing protein [Bacteroides sp.]MBP6936970.1 transglycosylase domain-containing protein [Bacteroides sp.]MBP8621839.1 transglycosylase domain-containing protein [Bacteroides sp.]